MVVVAPVAAMRDEHHEKDRVEDQEQQEQATGDPQRELTQPARPVGGVLRAGVVSRSPQRIHVERMGERRERKWPEEQHGGDCPADVVRRRAGRQPGCAVSALEWWVRIQSFRTPCRWTASTSTVLPSALPDEPANTRRFMHDFLAHASLSLLHRRCGRRGEADRLQSRAPP